MREADPKIEAKLQQLEAEMHRKSITPGQQEQQQIGHPIHHTLAIPLYLLLIPWGQRLISQFIFDGRWNIAIIPRHIDGLSGILFSAFSHANFAHLIANSIPFVLFSWLILFQSYRRYWITLMLGWLGGGVLCWLIGPTPVHGLSGVVYTLFGYLLWIGWQEKRLLSLAISVLVLVNYGGLVWGVLPQEPQVAWWGHLIGFVLGIGTAYYLGKNSGNASG